jgi:hypothetical protein
LWHSEKVTNLKKDNKMTQVIDNDTQEILEVYEAIDNIAPDSKKTLIAPLRTLRKEDIFTDTAKTLFLTLVRDEVASFIPDISTEKGREEIKANGRKIAKIRNRIEDVKKTVTEQWRVKTNEVNAQARDIKAQLEALEELALKPLTDFNNAEKARIQEHEEKISEIEFYAKQNIVNIETAESFLTSLKPLLERDWQEFKDRAERAYDVSIAYVNEQLARLQEIARQQAELAELNRKAEEARQKEREEQIRREAEEKARREAEVKAEAERQAILKAQQEKHDAEIRKQREEQEKIEAENRAKLKAEQDRLDAERKKAQEEKEALEKQLADQKVEAERAKREADEKALKEKQEAERVEAERLKREADLEHRKAINNQAVSDLLVHGITKEQAIAIVTAIAKKEIANISIAY